MVCLYFVIEYGHSINSELWAITGHGEEIDKAACGDGFQRVITADTKWSEVQVLVFGSECVIYWMVMYVIKVAQKLICCIVKAL